MTAFYLSEVKMENISLTKKQQDEVLRSVRLGALAQLKEDSPVLLSIEDISIMINRSYNYTSRHIITRQDFPSPVSLEKGANESKRYKAGDVIKWQKAYLRRVN